MFHQFKKQGVKVLDQSLIKFEMVKVNDWPEADWVFFYSPNAVKFYFEQRDYDPDKHYAVLSEGTARQFCASIRREPEYIGNSNAEHIAKAMLPMTKGKKILFATAKNSLHSLSPYFGESQKKERVIVYDNRPLENFHIPPVDILVFTSPMNVKAYFSKYQYRNEQLFAIGKTTAASISNPIDAEVKYCEDPGEESLYQLVADNVDL